MIRRPGRRVLPSVAAAFLLLAADARATTVRIPAHLDLPFLRDALVRQLYTAPGPMAPVLDDGHDCARLALAAPALDADGTRLRLRTTAHARLGTVVLGRCTLPLDWSGEIEVFFEPRTEPGSPTVAFRVVDSRIRRPDGSRPAVSGALWDWIKTSVHSQLSAFQVDLARPLEDLRAFLPLVLPDLDVAQVRRLVDSVDLAGARIAPAGIVAELQFDVPGIPATGGASPEEPPPSPEQIAGFEAALRRWDGFLTFVLKHAGRDTPDRPVRRELLAILLDARSDLVEALSEQDPKSDPVRTLFLSTWTRLSPVLRRLTGELPWEDSLRYLSFVAAGDALAALDRLGPSAGIDVSAPGLRRLARMLAPSDTADPLASDDALDPELREIFGFGDPIAPPPPDDEASTGTLLRVTWTPERRVLGPDDRARLRGWTPTPADLDEYLPLVHSVLTEAGELAAAHSKLDVRLSPLHGSLVLAAAWKESCWRQFVRHGGQAIAIRSSAGAVGILQVNPRVWRGFYDPRSLERDVSYNARAGAEILAHYLVDYAVPAEERGSGSDPDALARSTYAAYNGGPRAVRRWRNPGARADLRRIDEAFWRDYQAVKTNGFPDVATCYGV